ncbi:MAG: diphthine--ammonia ligase [Candidatus Hermodarchaeota archaeon]
MCGIIGAFNTPQALKIVQHGLKLLDYRGMDGQGIRTNLDLDSPPSSLNSSIEDNVLGHRLHAIVSKVQQPFCRNGMCFVSNSEIYNWNALNEKYDLKAQNDAELLFFLLQKNGLEALNEVDGVYAFALWTSKEIILARDIIGVKPLWYSTTEGFTFASEKKALTSQGIAGVFELNPRLILKYDLSSERLLLSKRPFFTTTPPVTDSTQEIIEKVARILIQAVKKRVPEQNIKLGILFSGGLDSSLLAYICQSLNVDFTCYTTAIEGRELRSSEDLEYAKKIAAYYGFPHKAIILSPEELEAQLKIVVPLLEDTNVMKVGVGTTIYLAAKQARKDNCKVVFTGLGSEELFAGYQRYKTAPDINKECLAGLRKTHERDTYRDDVLTMANNIELRLPFLDHQLVDYCLRIPSELKLEPDFDKVILRKTAIHLSMNPDFAYRKRRAAQYGSNIHRALKKLAKKHNYKRISDYLWTFFPKKNLKLGALFSTGKDSAYATWIMMRQNYEVACFIHLKSENPESYMFHTPTAELVKYHALAANIPLVQETTSGIEEKELEDLKRALQRAKDEHNIDGVITGALFSTYQRDRIEKVCDMVGLKIFSPLWHIDQEIELYELLKNKFEFIMTAVASMGLDQTWLGKTITEIEVARLVELNKQFGINVAGEGGEYESFVLDCPFFHKKLQIKNSEIKGMGSDSWRLLIKEIALLDKK